MGTGNMRNFLNSPVTFKFQTMILLHEIVCILTASVLSHSILLRSGFENPVPTLVGMYGIVVIVSGV
jgi:hypothetical protein